MKQKSLRRPKKPLGEGKHNEKCSGHWHIILKVSVLNRIYHLPIIGNKGELWY